MYQMDIEAGFTSPKHCRSVAFSLVKYGAPEGTRTPNLLIRRSSPNRSSTAWHFACCGCAAEVGAVLAGLGLMDSPMDKVRRVP